MTNFIQIIISCACLLQAIIADYTVHLIPNSHIDVGWGWTIDQYYINRVVNIYNTIHKELQLNEERTFSICEIIYFKWWYYNQTQLVQETFKRWSKEGRIEFVGGGLVMNDEANPSFQDIIDNYDMGFEFLKAEFNIKPQIGWFLDPFGHSAGNSYLMNKLGFKQLVMNRIDIEEKKHRLQTKTYEFIWKPFNNEEIITHVMPLHYDANDIFPFAFRQSYTEKQIKENIIDWALNITKTIDPYQKGFQHKHYLLLMGQDFSYQRENRTYPIMDALTKLRDFTYEDQKITFIYSNASKYFDAIAKDINHSDLPIQREFEFFPLRDRPQQFWSGYFGSRPYLKGKIRSLSNTYLVSSKFLVESLLRNQKYVDDLREILSMVGIMQHHDTITGTSNEYVSNDYIKLCNEHSQKTNDKVKKLLSDRLFQDSQVIQICLNNPIINYECQNVFDLISKEDSMIIGVLNPLITGKVLITIEFSKSEYEYVVYDKNNQTVASDFYCITNPEFQYKSKCFMSFFYLFNKQNDIISFTLKRSTTTVKPLIKMPNEKFNLIKEGLGTIEKVDLDPLTLTFYIKNNNENNDHYNFSLLHGEIPGSPRNSCEFQIKNDDGMYIFSPCTKRPIILTPILESSFVYKGSISSAIIINYNSSYLIANVYYNEPDYIKVDSIMNSITSLNGTNFALILESDIKNNITLPSNKTEENNNNSTTTNNDTIITQPEFWTDSNGMQMMKRIKQFRDLFPLNDSETVAGNFYPVTHAISIRQKTNATYTYERYSNLSPDDRMITIYNDRPQAGASLQEGEIILLISRTSTRDDNRGIGSALYETKSSSVVFKVQHIIMLGRSIYHKDKDGMLSTQFIYNHFHNTPILFSNTINKIFQSYSALSEMIIVSNNIIMNLKIKSQTKIIVQFYCVYDYYFNSIKHDTKGTQSNGLITVLPDNKYTITLHQLNGTKIQTDDQINQKGFSRRLLQNDFLVMHLHLILKK